MPYNILSSTGNISLPGQEKSIVCKVNSVNDFNSLKSMEHITAQGRMPDDRRIKFKFKNLPPSTSVFFDNSKLEVTDLDSIDGDGYLVLHQRYASEGMHDLLLKNKDNETLCNFILKENSIIECAGEIKGIKCIIITDK